MEAVLLCSLSQSWLFSISLLEKKSPTSKDSQPLVQGRMDFPNLNGGTKSLLKFESITLHLFSRNLVFIWKR